MNNIELLQRSARPRGSHAHPSARALHRAPTIAPAQRRSPPSIAELRGAIDAAKLTVHYQPQIHIGSGAIHAVEALIRWDDETHGLLLPNAFLTLANGAGLDATFTDFVLSRLLSQLVLWRRFNFRFGGAINIPDALISAPEFVAALHRKVSQMGIRPKDVTVEVSEWIATSGDIVVLENLLELRLKGFGVAMEALGTREWDLTELEGLPLTQIKADRSLIVDAANRPKLRNALQSGAAIARRLGVRTAAVGVEREEEWQLLSRLGFDVAQGFFIAAPMSAQALPDWVVDWNRQVH